MTRNDPDLRAEPRPVSAPWPDLVLPIGIFLLAFAVRLFYLFRIETFPLFYHLIGDAQSYDEWAQRIAAGEWWGEGVFYQAPLYPYFLGFLQSLLGHDLWWIRVVQILLGAASCSLLYWAGKLFFCRWAGMAAGLILSLYAPAIFAEGLIQKAVLDLFLATLSLVLLASVQRNPHRGKCAAIGALLGLLVLTRENAAVWLLVVPVWIWFYFAKLQPKCRAGWIGAFLIGVSIVLLPVGLRNWKVGGEFTLTTAQMGTNFFIGNNPLADGTYIPLRAGRGDPKYEQKDATEIAAQALGRALSPREVSAYWLWRSWDYIRSEPLDWIRLMGRKWLIVWNVRELEDADDFYLYQRWSWLLRVLGWANHFGLLVPLAAMGLVLTWRQWRELWLLYALLLTFALTVALFYVFGRYRLAMVPALALFAGASLSQYGLLFRQRRVRQGLIAAAALLLTIAMVYWPVMGERTPSAAGLNNLGIVLAQQGRIDMAIRSYQLALQAEPRFIVAHYNLATLLARHGKVDEAILHLHEAIKINPGYAMAHNKLGEITAAQGDVKGAVVHFREAVRIQPQLAEARRNLEKALALRSKKP